ncbi:MAG: putative flavoprotein (TIGR03862 family) [Saprospiraceae bacterium]|jgi:uncharacterized flavoprotein (TIGR03862 family)
MKKSVAIVGGGTAGLFLAAFLDADLFEVTIFEKKASFGRKFLVAGDGGFNLTHSENIENFKERYTPSDFLMAALNHFTNSDLRAFLVSIGIPTFVGSSKRVFPEKGIKPIEVLKALKRYLIAKKVNFKFNQTFTDWDEKDNLIFNNTEIVKSDFKVFAIGGGSWKVTGSDGMWLNLFAKRGIKTLPFVAQNCAFQVNWSTGFIQENEGKPLKNISISIDNQHQKGEVVITKFGMEGNALYALSPKIQGQLALKKEAIVYIDFKPTLSVETLLKKIKDSNYNLTKILKQVIKLNATQIGLIKNHLSKAAFLELSTLVDTIKKFPVKITDAAVINEAISTSGGIDLNVLNEYFELIDLKNNFCIGEMMDWNAPTGGYLIQGCASMGVYVANYLNERVK